MLINKVVNILEQKKHTPATNIQVSEKVYTSREMFPVSKLIYKRVKVSFIFHK